MWVTQEDLDWFHSKLQTSECAEVKLLYLVSCRFIEGEPPEDPLQLGCGTVWTLEKVLRAARLIGCDERQLWEQIGQSFWTNFANVLDPWNEQMAIKVVYQFLSQHNGGSNDQKEEEEEEFVEALGAYAAVHIKPQQAQGLCTSACLQGAESPDGGFRCALKVVPMDKGDSYSEGGLVCDRPVRAFGELLRVPRSDMFFKDTVLRYCDLGVAAGRDGRLVNLLENVEALLVMSFLYELHIVGAERSHWRHLLLSCPRSYPTVPLFWELGDLRELVGTDILDNVLQKREEIKKFTQTIQNLLLVIWEALLPASGELTFEKFKLAFSAEAISFAKATFDSRAFNLNVDGNVVLALVPIADMVNHQNVSNVLVRKVEPDGGDFVMLVGAALEESDVGRELWMSYGPLQNWELLLHYGFVVPQNAHDKLPFPFQVATANEKDTWGRRRHHLVERHHLYLHGQCWLAVHGAPCEALRALLRVHLAQPEEFEAMESKGPFSPLSSTTEMAVVETVEHTVRCVLEQFPDSLDEDKAMLAEMTDGVTDMEGCQEVEHVNGEDCASEPHALDNYRLCLQLRIGLKEIAYRALQWCEDARASIEDGHGC